MASGCRQDKYSCGICPMTHRFGLRSSTAFMLLSEEYWGVSRHWARQASTRDRPIAVLAKFIVEPQT